MRLGPGIHRLGIAAGRCGGTAVLRVRRCDYSRTAAPAPAGLSDIRVDR